MWTDGKFEFSHSISLRDINLKYISPELNLSGTMQTEAGEGGRYIKGKGHKEGEIVRGVKLKNLRA